MGGGPAARGPPINCQFFYHAVLTFADDWKRWSTFWEKKSAPRERKSWGRVWEKGPRLTLLWGPRMVNPALDGNRPRSRRDKKWLEYQRGLFWSGDKLSVVGPGRVPAIFKQRNALLMFVILRCSFSCKRLASFKNSVGVARGCTWFTCTP